MIEIFDRLSGSLARISPGQGFNCFQFEASLGNGEVISVINAPDDFLTGNSPVGRYGNPVLFPYPNRIASGRFRWGERDFELRPDEVLFDESGNAIHGLCIDRPWRVIDQTDSSVTGVFRLSVDAPERRSCWPADAEIQIRYEVRGTSLLSEIQVFNPDEHLLPWGFGTHGYFNVPFLRGTQLKEYTIVVPSETLVELQDCLPTGAMVDAPSEKSLRSGRSFAGLHADDVYSQLIPEEGAIHCRLDHEMSGICVEQRCSLDFRELVVFTPWWSSSVCMEPYTCMTNAINLQQRGIDAGLRVLGPGEHWTGRLDLHVRNFRD